MARLTFWTQHRRACFACTLVYMRLHARTLHMAQLTFWTSNRRVVRRMHINIHRYTLRNVCPQTFTRNLVWAHWRILNILLIRSHLSCLSSLKGHIIHGSIGESKGYLILTRGNKSALRERKRNAVSMGVAKKPSLYVFSCLFKASWHPKQSNYVQYIQSRRVVIEIFLTEKKILSDGCFTSQFLACAA